MTKPKQIKKRLEHLRGELRAERISYGELHELQSLAANIEPGDVELLEAAGVPEFPVKVLFAVKIGDEPWREQLITEVEERIESAKVWALANGFHKLRVATIDRDTPPDFRRCLAKGGRP